MNNEYVGMIEGEIVVVGSYEECLTTVGCCGSQGWYIPTWMDASVVKNIGGLQRKSVF